MRIRENRECQCCSESLVVAQKAVHSKKVCDLLTMQWRVEISIVNYYECGMVKKTFPL
jgi:hypothetical protein